MPTFVRRAKGTGQWQQDAMDQADESNRNFSANQWERGYNAAGNGRAEQLALARLQQADAASAQERQDRLSGLGMDYAYRKAQLDRGDAATKADIDFRRERLGKEDTWKERDYAENKPFRDMQVEDMQSRAALNRIMAEKEKTKQQTMAEIAGKGFEPPTESTPNQEKAYRRALASTGDKALAQAAAEDVAAREGKDTATALLDELGSQVGTFHDKDAMLSFEADPGMADVEKIKSLFIKTRDALVASGVPLEAATRQAKTRVEAAQNKSRTGWDFTLRQALGIE
jgi:hypothetical protein